MDIYGTYYMGTLSLIFRCIWTTAIQDDALFNQVIDILISCDLVYEVQPSSPDKIEKDLIVPWFFKEDSPISIDEKVVKLLLTFDIQCQ